MHHLKPNRRVPEGVDPQSWLGFEDRIGQRRFAALSVRIHEAVATGDVVAARAALDEARELRPDAPELIDLETLVLTATGVVANGFGQRAAGAVALLVLGVSMVVGIEWMRRGVEPGAPGALGALGALGASGASGAAGALGAPSAAEIPAGRPTPLLVQSAPTVPALPALATSTSPSTASLAPSPSVMPPSAPVTLPPVVAPRAAERSRTAVAATATPLTSSGPPVATAERPPRESEPRPMAVARAAEGDSDSLPPAGTPAEPPPPTPREASRPREASIPAPPLPANGPATASIPPLTPAPRPVTAGAVDESRVADVLRQYARAYGDLDASAARDIWPSVDQRALARAFDSLRSQQLSLQDCRIDVHGATANASCRGQAQYVGKVGSGEPRIEPRTWRFELRREGEAWKIAHAEARRPTS